MFLRVIMAITALSGRAICEILRPIARESLLRVYWTMSVFTS